MFYLFYNNFKNKGEVLRFSIEEIINNSDAELIFEKDLSGDFDISTDTRKITKGDIYLPLRGENFDGHNFIDKALELGAKGYFTQDKRKINKNANFILYSKNTLVTYLQLANYIRRKINPTVIAITGSCGKTTIKEMLSCTLSTTYKVHKSILNHNNEIGLCETMFQMPVDTQIAVIEMGMRNLGEIEMLSKYCMQDYAIISNVGSAHVERLGSLENIAVAKCEIAHYLKEDKTIFAHDDKLIREKLKFSGEKVLLSIKDAEKFEISKNSSKFTYKGEDYEIKIEGEHNIENAILVIECAKKLNVPAENIKKGLLEFKPIEKRWEISEIKDCTFINDSYNANPESMLAALKTFLSVYKDNHKLLVLGDMLELGKDEIEYHKNIGEFLDNKNNTDLITVGKLSKYISNSTTINSKHFNSNEDCAKYIAQNIKANDILFFKASRSMKFEEIIEEVKQL